MFPHTPPTTTLQLRSSAESLAAWRAETHGRRTLSLLAGLLLLGGTDLSMTTLALRHHLLDAASECNPLAALVLPFGFGALLAYKAMLTIGGSVGLIVCRQRWIVEVASGLILIAYALVAIRWMEFYAVCVPLREVSPNLGDFCRSANWVGCVMLSCGIAVCLAARARTCQRRRQDRRRTGLRKRRTRGPRTASVAALAICSGLLPLCCSSVRSEPERTEITVGGTIYFRRWLDPDGRVWSMNADGSNKSVLPIGVYGEPSHQLHGDHRWFLDVRDVPGQRYPDGGQRRELFALRSDGLSVQLSDQQDLEPAPFTPRWLAHAEDRVISWIARRWGKAGQVVEGGIYTASVIIDDDDGHVIGLVEQPGDPLVRLELTRLEKFDPWWRTWAPDIRSHDWSPDGAAIVYDSTKSELFICDSQKNQPASVTDVPACSPVWSPDGKRIAFKIYGALREIATICPDGRDLKTVTGHPTGKRFSVTTPTWSPTGGHFAYQQLSFRKSVDSPADSDVFVAPADGRASVNLTEDVETSLIPVGWR